MGEITRQTEPLDGADARGKAPSSSGARQAPRHAPTRRPLPPRPQQAPPARGPAGTDAGAPHHRDDDVPRDGNALLVGGGGGGNEAARVKAHFELTAAPT